MYDYTNVFMEFTGVSVKKLKDYIFIGCQSILRVLVFFTSVRELFSGLKQKSTLCVCKNIDKKMLLIPVNFQQIIFLECYFTIICRC